MKNMLKEPCESWQTDFYFREDHPLDQEDARFMLLTMKHVLESHGVVVMPIYGTLLGAVREHGFIKHDVDIDLVTYGKNLQKILALCPELEKYDIHLRAYCKPWIITFLYKGIQCDIDMLHESMWPWTKHFYLLSMQYISRSFFDKTEKYELFGEQFTVPASPERLVAYLYGKTWRIPSNTRPHVESYFFFWRYAHRFIQKCLRYAKKKLLRNK